MESKAKALGHPIHPMLIVFPLGLFVSAVIFDIVYLFTGNEFFPAVSYYNILGGLIGGLVAALFGFRDYLAIPSGTRAKSVAGWHGLGNVIVIGLFFVSWFMRANAENFVPDTTAFILTIAAIMLATVTGWLGGELVDRLGVGVDPGANLNASSSLSGQPASHRSGDLSVQGVPVTGERKYQEKHIQKDFSIDPEEELPAHRQMPDQDDDRDTSIRP